MAVRLSTFLTGASLLALALPAFAQDHSHHGAPPAPPSSARQTPPSDPHAGHAAPAMPQGHVHSPGMVLSPPRSEPADPHAGHDMATMDHPTTSTLGHWPMTRDASGTSWQPDLSVHGGVHTGTGDWSLMGHAQLNLVYDWQNGPRGDEKMFVSGMIMGAARRD
ncbi:MAG: hypothetical protein FD125_102, partial [bacterium]